MLGIWFIGRFTIACPHWRRNVRVRSLIAGCLVILLACVPVARAQEQAEEQVEPVVPAPGSGNELRLDFTAGVWLPRLLGDATLGPGGTELDLQDNLGMDDLEPSF